MPRLSVVLPTYQEEKLGILPKLLESLNFIEVELLVIDSGSIDSTVDIICSSDIYKNFKKNVSIIKTNLKKRGEKLKLGFQKSKGEIILFHHPRSILQKDGIIYLLQNENIPDWGGFTHKFDSEHFILKFTSFYSNFIRAQIKNIFYLDHCIFAKKEILKLIEIPEVEIFEDTLLSQNLKGISKSKLLPYYSTTSSIRFHKNGIYFQSVLNQLMKIGFYCKIPFPILNRLYEKSIELNSKISL